jgi:hypothetical protein
MTVVLDDVDDPSTTGPATVRLDLGASYGWASQVDLGGQAVQAGGAHLQVAGGSTSVCAGVDIEPCNGSAGQQWTVT